MHATVYKTITVKLELSEIEAVWLKRIMQNPFQNMFSPTKNIETQTDKTMREIFFRALDEAGVPST